MATPPTPSLGVQNWYADSLAQSAGASDTTFYVNNVPTPTEGYLVIDPNNTTTREVIHYTSKGSGTVILPGTGDRGLDGTTAQSHAQGTAVVMNYTSSYFTALQTLDAVANNSVTASLLAPNAIKLGYSAITTLFNTFANSDVEVTGLATTVTVPAGGRDLEVTVTGGFGANVAATNFPLKIWDGTVGSGTLLKTWYDSYEGSNGILSSKDLTAHQSTPSAGSHTYRFSIAGDGSHTVELYADALGASASMTVKLI